MVSELESGLACTLTSSDVSEKTGYGIIFGKRNGFGFVCAMTNFLGTSSDSALKVVGNTGDIIVLFDNLPTCSMARREFEI